MILVMLWKQTHPRKKKNTIAYWYNQILPNQGKPIWVQIVDWEHKSYKHFKVEAEYGSTSKILNALLSSLGFDQTITFSVFVF